VTAAAFGAFIASRIYLNRPSLFNFLRCIRFAYSRPLRYLGTHVSAHTAPRRDRSLGSSDDHLRMRTTSGSVRELRSLVRPGRSAKSRDRAVINFD